MATDPYAAPKAPVADAPAAALEGEFVPEGRALPAGNGWNWIASGWDVFRQNPGVWILIAVIFFVLAVVVQFIPVLGPLAMSLLGPVLAGGLMIGCRALEQGDTLEIGHLFAGFRENTGKLVLVGVFGLVAFILVMVVIGLMVGGSVFALAAGGGHVGAGLMGIALAALVGLALALPIYMAMWFAPALVALQGTDAIEALKASFFACLKNVLAFLVYGVIMFALAIVASIPFGLGWLVLAPVLIASVYTAYRDIFFAR
ncbi:MAG: DUF2189 domain-containing protein [Burkholderiales bacterium]|nr:DUF2189 domain-containing protein [Burkholderiales bacterium]